MVDLDDELSWTTVVRRRVHKQRIRRSQFPSLPPHRACHPSSQAPLHNGAPAAVPAPVPHEGGQDYDDEALVLLRMKRSLLRVQESEFFRQFLDQTASPSVLDNLRRAATPPSELELHTQECTADAVAVCTYDDQGENDGGSAFERLEGMASGTLSTERFAHRSTHKIGEVPLKLENSSIKSDKDGEFAVAVGDKPPHSTDLLLQPPRKEKLGAGISNERWKLQIVVYGLGKIADSEVSRCQFALILLLKQNFHWIGGIEIYDPILSQSECSVIQGLGCTTIAINEEGRRSIEEPTLFYMPHCEDWLYDNVLQANWTPLKLRQMVILGNSFRSYQERWSSFLRTGSKPPPTYVLELQQTAHEIPLEATSSLELPVFNNLSWHFFQGYGSKLQSSDKHCCFS